MEALESQAMTDQPPLPKGDLSLRIIPGRQDSNHHGSISAGWVTARMDEAAENLASQIACGRVANVSMGEMVFMAPIRLGAPVSIYTQLQDIGRSSMRIEVEVWAHSPGQHEQRKVVDSAFVYVAIDDRGRIRSVPRR